MFECLKQRALKAVEKCDSGGTEVESQGAHMGCSGSLGFLGHEDHGG